MLKTLRFILVCLTGLISFQLAAQQATFQKRYGGTQDDFGMKLIQTSDFGFVQMGYSLSYGQGSSDILLTKTDKDGLIVFSKTIGGSAAEIGYDLIETLDGGLLLLAESSSTTDPTTYIIKTTAAGVVQWEKNYRGGQGGILMDMGATQLADSSYIVVTSSQFSSGNGDRDINILKLNTNGTLQFVQAFGTANAEDRGVEVAATSDGGFVIGGQIETAAGHTDVFVAKFNSSAVVQWQRKIDGTTSGQGERLNAILQTPDGGYVMAIEDLTASTSSSDMIFYKMSSTGTTVYGKKWAGSRNDVLQDIALAANGDIFATGKTSTFGGADDDMVLFRVSGTGALRWFKRFNVSQEHSRGRSVVRTCDDGAAVLGTTNISGNFDYFLVKTDNAGFSGCGQSDQTSFIQLSLVNYVPTIANVTLSITSTATTQSFTSGTTTPNLISATACAKPQDAVSITAAGPYCPTDAKDTFSVNIPGGTWSGTGITDAAIGEFDPSVAGSGTHTIAYTVNICGAVSQGTRNITVHPQPTANAGPDQSINACNSGTLGGSPTGQGGTAPLSFSWSPGIGLSSTTVANPTVDAISTQTYTVIVTDANGCFSEDDVLITVTGVNPLTVNGGGRRYLCSGDCVQLGGPTLVSGGTQPYSYTWSPTTDLSNPFINNPSACPTTTITYTVNVKDQNGCAGADTITVDVSSVAPIVNAGDDTFTCIGNPATLGGDTVAIGNGPFTYNWIPNCGLSSQTVDKPSALCATSETYIVTVTDKYGCIGSDQVEVTRLPPPTVGFTGLDSRYCKEDDGPTLRGYPTGGSFKVLGGGLPVTQGNTVAPNFDRYSSSFASAPILISDNSTTTLNHTVNITELVGFMGERVTLDSVSINIKHARVGDLSANLTGPGGQTVRLMSRPGFPVSSFGCQGPDLNVNFVRGTNNAVENICNGSSPAIAGDRTAHGTDNLQTFHDGVTSPNGTWTLVLTDSLSGTVGTLEDWTFYFTRTTATLTLDSTGIFSVVYTYNDPKTGCAGADTQQVLILDLPTANAGKDTNMCPGDTIMIGVTPVGSGTFAPYTYEWAPGTADMISSATAETPWARAGETTTYTVTVTDSIGCEGEDEIEISILSADAGPDLDVCANSQSSIGGSPTASGGVAPYLYTWSPGAGLSSITDPNPSIINPSVDDTFRVVVSDSVGCFDTAYVAVTVNSRPIVDAGNDTAICLGDTARLGGQPTASGFGGPPFIFAWTPGNLVTDDSISNTKGFPDTPTEFVVTVTDTNGCQGTDTVFVDIYELPTVNAGVDTTTICGNAQKALGGNPTATGGQGPYVYEWLPTSGFQSFNDVANPVVNPVENSRYTVFVRDANGCKGQDSIYVFDDINFLVSAGPDDTVCVNKGIIIGGAPSATPNNYSTIFSYAWNPGSSLNNSTFANPTAFPAQTTFYTLEVTDENGCKGNDIMKLTVLSSPIVNAGVDKTVCNGVGTAIGAQPTASGSGPFNYVWSPADFLNSTTVSNPTVSPLAARTYTVNVTDVNGCSSSDVVAITVNDLPIVSAGGTHKICNGEDVVLGSNPTASGGTGPYQYSWTPSNGLNSASISNPIAKPLTSTTYTLVVTDVNNCQGTDQAIVNINPILLADAGGVQEVCLGNNGNIGGAPTALGGTAPYFYSWAPATGLNSSVLSNPTVIQPQFNKVYTVTISDSLGCKTTDAVEVKVLANPIADAGSNIELCAGKSTFVGGNPSGTSGQPPYTYAWSPVAFLNDPSLANPQFNSFAAGSIDYKLIVVDAKGCRDSSDITVDINALPVVKYGANNVTGMRYEFRDSSTTNIQSWAWDFGDGTSSNKKNPDHTYIFEDDYIVCLTVIDEKGCENTKCDTLEVTNTIGINDINGGIGMNIYPNPAIDMITIKSDIPLNGRYDVKIIDMEGRLVRLIQFEENNGNTVLPLDISTLSVGQYLVELSSEKGLARSMFIKTK